MKFFKIFSLALILATSLACGDLVPDQPAGFDYTLIESAYDTLLPLADGNPGAPIVEVNQYVLCENSTDYHTKFYLGISVKDVWLDDYNPVFKSYFGTATQGYNELSLQMTKICAGLDSCTPLSKLYTFTGIIYNNNGTPTNGLDDSFTATASIDGVQYQNVTCTMISN